MTERKKVTKEEFCQILLHTRGRKNSGPEGTSITNLDISGMDLSEMDLTNTRFINVDFSNTLGYAIKASGIVFSSCILDGMIVRGSDLEDSRFFDCSMNGTQITRSSLRKARISSCEITNAYLTQDDFCKSVWYSTSISDTSFSDSLFVDAGLDDNRIEEGVKGLPPLVCPEEGSFIAYKRVENYRGHAVVAKLLIPADAERSSATTRKCRASKAIVLEFYNRDRKKLPVSRIKYGYSSYDRGFKYERTKTVTPRRPFDTNRWHECAHGIHFFMTFEEAANYGRI